MPAPEVRRAETGVVFVSFHSEDLLVPLVERFAGAGHPVVVVDNSGTYPHSANTPAGVVDPGANVGFGAACNLGAAELPRSVRSLCFHNPDVTIDVHAIGGLASVLGGPSGVGIVCPAEQEGSLVRRRGYHYPGPLREIAVALRARKGAAPAFSPVAGASGTTFASERGRRFGGGGLAVVDREAFRNVGGFDESYFLYAEDLDLWHRFGVSGIARRFEPSVCALHAGGSGSRMASSSRELLRQAGIELFVQRFASSSAWRMYRAIHRSLLSANIREDTGLVGEVISSSWTAGAPPDKVQSAIREALSVREPCLS